MKSSGFRREGEGIKTWHQEPSLRHDAAGAGLKLGIAIVLRPHWSDTVHYSLPMTESYANLPPSHQ